MTTLLTEKDLGKMKKVQELNLPETAYIQALTVTNGSGGWSEAWTTRETKPARIGEPKGEMEKGIASTVTTGKVYTITLPAGVVVGNDDRIQINSIDYRVHWTNENKSHKTATRVVVSEV
jgi:hypothetical protein